MNEHKNIITIEDEIKEFSDKPVKSSVLYKKVKELESNAVPDASEASVGDVLTKGEDGIGWSAPSGGGGGAVVVTVTGPDDDGYYHTNKTPRELYAAYLEGSAFVCDMFTNDGALKQARLPVAVGVGIVQDTTTIADLYVYPITGDPCFPLATNGVDGKVWFVPD